MNLKKSVSVFSAMVLSASLCSCSQKQGGIDIPDITGEFKVSVLKAGQADAIILETQNHSVIIDCGENDDGDKILEYLSDRGIQKIDYMFITHFDKDHVGGAPEVISGIKIGNIVTPDYEGTNKEYEKYCEALHKYGYEPLRLTEELSFTFDDVLFEVYPPMKTEYGEGDNDFSIVISVSHGDNRFLFTGDAEKERISEALSQISGEYDFIKIPHHGRYEKNTKEFLESVRPKYAVITCSDKNPADEQVLEILNYIGCEIYFTSNENIEAVSDGWEIKILK